MPADANSSPSVPDLRQRVDQLAAELNEALRREAAIAEILQVTNASGGDLALVLNAIIEKATRLCWASYGYIWTYDGESARAVAVHGDARFEEWLRQRDPVRPSQHTLLGRVLLSKRLAHIVDAKEDETYRDNPRFRDLVDRAGLRTLLHVPLRKGDTLLGVITVYRRERQAFTDQQIRLLESFAEQAVIAMENVRLLDDQREALEQQTATGEVLRVISQSPTDVAPVLQAVGAAARRFCGAEDASIFLRDGEEIVAAAHNGPISALSIGNRDPLDPSTSRGQSIIEGRTVHIPDVEALDPNQYTLTLAYARQYNFRATVSAPMLRGGRAIGCIALRKPEPGPFTARQIALLESFADQAVIAIGNVRLFTELRQRTDDLTESLEYQTAISELLEVISRSTSDVRPVFETILSAAKRLCDVENGGIAVRSGDVFRYAIVRQSVAEMNEILLRRTFDIDRTTLIGRVAAEARVVHIGDVQQDGEYAMAETAAIGGFRTMLGVPLMQNQQVVGVIVLTRLKVEPFTERQIALVRTFADQAVIAMENARLLGELTRREEELRVTFDNMGDGVVMFDGCLKLASWNRNFQELLDIPDSFLASHPGLEDYVRLLVTRGELGNVNMDKEVSRYRERATRQWSVERTRPDGRVLEVRNNPVPGGGAVLIYGDITRRKKAEEEIRAARDAAEAALERQTATADILKVIAGSPSDVQPVLDAIAASARRFCGADNAGVILREQAELRVAAHDGPLPAALGLRIPLDRSTGMGRSISDGRTVQIPDVLALDTVEFARGQELAKTLGFRAVLAVPMLQDEQAIGALLLRRSEPGEFTPQQIELLETFAAQAVIAIENVRLFTELREALEQQTATAEILTVISQSLTDVGPVLSAVAKAAMKFCGASDALVCLRDGNEWLIAAHEGPIETMIGARRMLTRHTAPGRAMTDGEVVQIMDIQSVEGDEFPETRERGARSGFRSALAAPLLRDDAPVGAISLRRREAGKFEPRQVELLKTFAAQAVIAIENVRLFTELREALEQQTASAEILQVISQSPTDVAPVLTAIAKAAIRFCNSPDAVIWLRDGDEIMRVAHEGPLPTDIGARRPLSRNSAVSRAVAESRTMHYPDLLALDPVKFADAQKRARESGYRAALAAPMLREGQAIGTIVLRKQEAVAYTERQIELLETFAAQAVIAIENVRLFTELRASLEHLKSAQANLIQAEKMASLGQLTAGIAHEIKNPLNFVNNFAGLSSELLDELKQAVDALLAEPDQDKRAELQETMDLLTSNLAKIVEHGRRADGIVKSMLAHSRGGSGDWQASNINALVEEALNLAYHGARAQDQDFNVTLERDFAPDAQPIEVVPQDVTRVFLNLFGNGFYAANKRQPSGTGSEYRPTLTVSTRDLGEAVEIRVRDNGTGIPPEVRTKLFQPFFTTKPTGEGTGLGLSISYDIVTQQHGGSIEVKSEPGSFTEFTVRLPRRRRAA